MADYFKEKLILLAVLLPFRARRPNPTTTTPTTIRTVLVVSEAPAVSCVAKPSDWPASNWYFASSAGLRATFRDSTRGAVKGAGLGDGRREYATVVLSEAMDDTAIESNVTTAIIFVGSLFILFLWLTCLN